MAEVALKIQEDEVVLESVTDIVDTLDTLDELDQMFEELEAGMTTETVVASTADNSVDLSDEEMEELGVTASIAEARADAIAEMDDQGEAVDDDSGIAAGAAETVKPKRAAPVTKRISSAGAPKSEALTKALGSKLDEYLLLDDRLVHSSEEDQREAVKAKLSEIDSLPVKIQEKAVNFYAHLNNGAALSNYTKIAIDLLVKNGEISSKELRDAYVARPYSLGTANSQCTQLMRLLQVLELATKEGGKLVANKSSLLLPMFSA